MKRPLGCLALLACTAACSSAAATDVGESGDEGAWLGSSAVVDARFEPACIRPGDEYRLELRIDHARGRRVWVELPGWVMDDAARAVRVEFFDDGSHGDVLAGDEVYSARFSLPPRDRAFGRHVLRSVVIELSDEWGTEEIERDLAATLLYVDPSVAEVPVEPLAPGLWRSEHMVSLAMELDGEFPSFDVDLASVTQRYYEFFEDDRDFIIAAYHFPTAGTPAGQFTLVRNDIDGIGVPLVDDGVEYGSDAQLQGVIRAYFGNLDPVRTNHELLHRWVGEGLEAVDLWGGVDDPEMHWGVIVRPNSGFVGPEGAMGVVENLVPFGDHYLGWQGPSGLGREFNDLELYLMGLISLHEVAGPILTLVDPSFRDYASVGRTRVAEFDASAMRWVTKAELVAALGPRTPVAQTPSEFRVALVVVSDRELTALEFAYYELAARELAAPTSSVDYPSFAEATGQRASLDTRIGSR